MLSDVLDNIIDFCGTIDGLDYSGMINNELTDYDIQFRNYKTMMFWVLSGDEPVNTQNGYTSFIVSCDVYLISIGEGTYDDNRRNGLQLRSKVIEKFHRKGYQETIGASHFMINSINYGDVTASDNPSGFAMQLNISFKIKE